MYRIYFILILFFFSNCKSQKAHRMWADIDFLDYDGLTFSEALDTLQQITNYNFDELADYTDENSPFYVSDICPANRNFDLENSGELHLLRSTTPLFSDVNVDFGEGEKRLMDYWLEIDYSIIESDTVFCGAELVYEDSDAQKRKDIVDRQNLIKALTGTWYHDDDNWIQFSEGGRFESKFFVTSASGLNGYTFGKWSLNKYDNTDINVVTNQAGNTSYKIQKEGNNLTIYAGRTAYRKR